MSKKKIFLYSALFIAFSSLGAVFYFSGSKVKVKDIVSDARKYELEKFYPSSLSKESLSAIKKMDNKTLDFKKITLTEDGVDNDQKNGGTTSRYQVKSVINNAGGSFVQTRLEFSNNKIPFRIVFLLSYRGIFSLKTQAVNLGENKSEVLWRVDDIEKFIPISSENKTIEIFGNAKPIKPKTLNAKCDIGETSSAKAINEKLEGDMVEINCNYLNDNGSVAYSIEYAYLKKYGVAITLSASSVNSTTQFYVTHVDIEI